jgi:chromate transporter
MPRGQKVRCANVQQPAADAPIAAPPRLSAYGVFLRFLRFGLHAWGGPTAQIALIRDELVERERWVEPDEFRRALAVYQALPGPEAHELCCWFGMRARGRIGALAAGLGFMLPGLVLMLVASWLYVRYGVRHELAAAAFLAVQAAVVGLVLRAVLRLHGALAKGADRTTLSCVGLFAAALAVPFWIPLVVGGLVAAATRAARPAMSTAIAAVAAASIALLGAFWAVPRAAERSGATTAASVADAPSSVDAQRLFATGLAGGLTSFGGAYTAIPVVQAEATGRNGRPGWMTDGQFLDGIAIGGVLPAPLVIFGTFVGWLGGGLGGALLVTLGMFLPAFAFTLIGHELFERLVALPRLHAFLDGVSAAVFGLVLATSIGLLLATIGANTALDPALPPIARPIALAIAGAAFVAFLLLKQRFAIPVVLALAALVGLLLHALGL